MEDGVVKTQVTAVLDEAIRLLLICGFVKGTFKSSDGRLCMSGAITAAAQTLHPHSIWHNPHANLALKATAKAIAGPNHKDGHFSTVITYNDRWWRTRKQAVQKLEEAKAFA